MVRRRNATGEGKATADGGPSNRHNPVVSVHIRVSWPPLATRDQIGQAIIAALVALWRDINRTQPTGDRQSVDYHLNHHQLDQLGAAARQGLRNPLGEPR
jgi:hypothetical protein